VSIADLSQSPRRKSLLVTLANPPSIEAVPPPATVAVHEMTETMEEEWEDEEEWEEEEVPAPAFTEPAITEPAATAPSERLPVGGVAVASYPVTQELPPPPAVEEMGMEEVKNLEENEEDS
jgi:hypothetical protein